MADLTIFIKDRKGTRIMEATLNKTSTITELKSKISQKSMQIILLNLLKVKIPEI